MKCIFLDFDGVINNWYHFEGVAKENANILKCIIERSGAKVIVTSSTKYEIQQKNKDYYSSRFYNTYVKPLSKLSIEISDITPNRNGNRILEIEEYLKNNPVEEYVILDDELVGPKLQPHQIFLELYRGLQEEHIEPALQILNGKVEFYPPGYNRQETPLEVVKKINKHYNQKN